MGRRPETHCRVSSIIRPVGDETMLSRISNLLSHRFVLSALLISFTGLTLACEPVDGTTTPEPSPTPRSTEVPATPTIGTATQTSNSPTPLPTVEATVEPAEQSSIIIGVEYVLLDNPFIISRQAELFGAAGFHGAKPIAEAHDWGTMQSGPDSEIDFSKLDNYVREFQAAGVSETTLALKSHSEWASVDHSTFRSINAAPKPEYRDLYADWITAIVERYDADGLEDMEGLLFPIRHYEIGSEFSSFEPEPVDEYLEMLEIAYEAAHAAYADVSVSHAAFLMTDFLLNDPSLDELNDDTGVDRYGPHKISEIRAILDRPDLFDVLNIHALAHPGEIEQLVRWLGLEMDERGYSKGIIISDTSPNPFISWGPANVCNLPANLMGLMIYPAVETDRCRAADYFQRVLQRDDETVDWMRGFVAADMGKKTVIAAEQGVELINTAFTTDLPILSTPLGFAGSGNAGWGGMVVIGTGQRYANYFAMQQLIGHIDGYSSIERLDVPGPEGVRLYELLVGNRTLWIGWYDPPRLVLHGDDVPEAQVRVPTGFGDVVTEWMIERVNENEPVLDSGFIDHSDGSEIFTLTPRPVFIWNE